MTSGLRRSPDVIIIGAGFGGMSVALQLKQSGIDTFTILEKQSEVGGVWQANDYPGAACDVPSVIYQFSDHLKPNWSRRFGSQSEIRDYIREVSIESGVRSHIRFGVEVVSAQFDEDTLKWTLTLADGEKLTADVLVGATGQLSRPRLPDVADRERFRGKQFHSAEWDCTTSLRGKRVVVVGGGASSIQIVPAIANEVAHLTVIQRSPSWVVGKYDWSPGLVERTLSRNPAFLRVYHLAMWWWFEVKYPFVLHRLDGFRSVYELVWRRRMAKILGDDQKYRACNPDYRMGCARLLLSNEWYQTLARPDVSVIRDNVVSMDESGVVVSDGTHIDADVVIWSTGFTATEYLAPIKITGYAGADLHQRWKDGPEAYLGVSTPDFPNMFMSYGPNTGSLTNTITSMLEYQAGYIRQAVEYIGRTGGAYSISQSVHDDFNDEIEQRLQGTIFTSGCPGWYSTPGGKVTTVWAGSHSEYKRRIAEFDPSVYQRIAPAEDRVRQIEALEEEASL
ncbi:NAD(P)/FAD-dependent oxidoreductase [Mycobacterium sp. CVI_P3]|uniref:NAD(P)/FAD-dependent oxidoreductase n=1 Tax=Mycobacterium pinniadriaticum TaxID=2994102 RepID=A0ABT3SDX8_9MYCO|nr:NAD(P)/FAD-dependent oxidoreductase [Mycobacterium pinniadriaticum]MCX2930663.1 NAD(P)/FAD-dependent oxidoreductase [Mycobacterium pinniadriaticum]MCX2937087.1 NAD(P)/FAD-dependent oxidoreductase [Mycobacterium pinniadriaticum]